MGPKQAGQDRSPTTVQLKTVCRRLCHNLPSLSKAQSALPPTTSTITIAAAAAVRINLNQKRDSFSLQMGLAADRRAAGTDVSYRDPGNTATISTPAKDSMSLLNRVAS